LLTGNASELQGEATQLIQYKIMITYLMEGKENMVTAMIGKFELRPRRRLFITQMRRSRSTRRTTGKQRSG
jgi:hypothetical protein